MLKMEFFCGWCDKKNTPTKMCRGVFECIVSKYYSATTSNGISTETSLWSFNVAV